MSQHAATAGTLEQSIGARRVLQITGVVAGAVLTAVAARLAVPLPGTVVPFTLQVAAVMLTGVLLGSRGGAASQVLYLAVGMAGVPVFAAGGGAAYLFGPTGGYLLAFPVAAAVAGHFATSDRLVVRVSGLILSVAVIHLAGMAWLGVIVGRDVAFATGVAPFLAGDVLKILLVLVIGAAVGRRSRKLFT